MATMRVAIADANAARREVVRRTLSSITGFQLVGETATAEHCTDMVAQELPDVVICGDLCEPLLDNAAALPVLITVGGAEVLAPERAVCNLAVPLRENNLAEALAMAAQRILQIKVEDLCRLIRAYTAYGALPCAPPDQIIVDGESGQLVSLATDEILWIKAAGNYVQLFTRRGRFELRQTISNMAARLEPSGFVRIHRGTVVNASAVRGRAISDGVVHGVILADGTQLPVGPNFRQQFIGGELLPLTCPEIEERRSCSD